MRSASAPLRPPRPLVPLCIAAVLALPGCDLLGIEGAAAAAARREAEGKAIGAACRHAARSIEVCHQTNKRADKAAVFAGWREMNDYMRENKIEPMPAPAPAPASATAADGDEEAPPAKAAAAKGGKGKAAAKAGA